MKFTKIDITNIHELMPYLQKQKYQICDLTVGTLYHWRDYFNYEYLIHQNNLYIRGLFEGKTRYLIPLGDDDLEQQIRFLNYYSLAQGEKLNLAFVTQEAIGKIDDGFCLIINPEYFDYVYNITDLINLKGLKYKRQRNHINKFYRLYKNYSYKEVTPDDIPQILEFLDEYKEETNERICAPIFKYEVEKTYDLVSNLFKLQQIAGILEVDGKVVALAIGEVIGNTVFVHIEKALRKYHGSYAVINNLFLKHLHREDLVYVNREEDLGDEGLRKAKQSYRPIKYIHKYNITVKESK
ncbi:MAG: DUF2156 domain-containing protein [Acholeplasmataceae bacterium]|nr:DUF2156 domain-containing protein [Acholeplasmataceae bacterium]